MATNVQNNTDGCLFVIDQLNKSLGISVSLDSVEGAVQTEKRKSLNFDMVIGSSLYTEVSDPDDIYPSKFISEYMSSGYDGVHDGWTENTPETHAHIVAEANKISTELDPA